MNEKAAEQGCAIAFVILCLLCLIGGFSSCVKSCREGSGDERPIDAGTPVMCAIRKFKKDRGVLPKDLDEIVDRGYLPRKWERGFSSLPEAERKVVEGQEWTTFLRYLPGENKLWKGKNWLMGQKEPDTSADTWGLAFNGLDGKPETNDDQPCMQDKDLKFDLDSLFSEVERTRAELARRRDALATRLEQLKIEEPKAAQDLKTQADELRARMEYKGLKSLVDVRSDPVALRRLALIGEIRIRQAAIAEKRKRIRDIHEMVLIELKRFENQDAMARIAESKEELASLSVLLDTSKDLLDDSSKKSTLDEAEKVAQGEAWFGEEFKAK